MPVAAVAASVPMRIPYISLDVILHVENGKKDGAALASVQNVHLGEVPVELQGLCGKAVVFFWAKNDHECGQAANEADCR